MSFRLTSIVLRSTLPARLKLYAAVLSEYAAKDGTRVYPGVATIAKRTGRSARSVQTAITELVRIGVLELVAPHGPGRPNVYRFNLEALRVRPTFAGQLELFDETTKEFPQGKPRNQDRRNDFHSFNSRTQEENDRRNRKLASPDPIKIRSLSTSTGAKKRAG